MLFVYHWNIELKPMFLQLYFLVKDMYIQTCAHTYVNMHALAIISKE